MRRRTGFGLLLILLLLLSAGAPAAARQPGLVYGILEILGLTGSGYTNGECPTWNATTGQFEGGACAGGSGAPTTAGYITKTADGTLSNELALGSLGTGLLINTTTTGVPTIYGGASCTNQFPRSLNASGAATCASVSLTADITGTLGLANGGLGVVLSDPNVDALLYWDDTAGAMAFQDVSDLAQDASVDGLEVLIGTTNTTLTTIDGRVDGLEGLLTTIDTVLDNILLDTADIEVAVELLDNTVGPVAAGTAAANSLLTGGVYNTSLPTLTNGQQAALQLDASGRVIVSIGAGATSGPTDTDDGSIAGAQTVGIGAALLHTWNGSAWARASVATDSTFGTSTYTETTSTGPLVGAVRNDVLAALANTDNEVAPLQVNADGALFTAGSGQEDTATATGAYLFPMGTSRRDTATSSADTTLDHATLNTDSVGRLWSNVSNSNDEGTFTYGAATSIAVIGYVAESTTDALSDGQAGAPIMTLGRVAYSTIAPTADTGQSASECSIISAASTNSTNCKNAAGNVYGYDLINTTTTTYYLRLYNTSSAPTCSSATGFIRSIPIPPAGAAGQAGGVVRVGTIPVGYATGISYCLTGGASSTDNTNAATGIYGAILYK